MFDWRDHRGMVNLRDQKGREFLMQTRMPAKTGDERGWCNISLVNYALEAAAAGVVVLSISSSSTRVGLVSWSCDSVGGGGAVSAPMSTTKRARGECGRAVNT